MKTRTGKKTRKLALSILGRVKGGQIILERKWIKAAASLEGFSHLIIIFWLDKARRPDISLRIKDLPKLPEIGFLATRTPHRANPIGVSIVKLLSRKGDRLTVQGLDAWDGTPIFDIKPYTRRDSVAKFQVPSWVKELDRLETDPLRRYG